MSVEYPGLIHCKRCGNEYSAFDTQFIFRGTDPQRHFYCPNDACLGHTLNRSLYWVSIEFA